MRMAGATTPGERSSFPAWAESQYRCMRRISQATNATVWLVRRTAADGMRLYVLKELHADGSAIDNAGDWPQEVALLTSQKHPFILPVVDMIRDAPTNQIGMVTEYCDQGDLHTLLIEYRRRGERVPEGQALTWLAQLSLALAHLHKQRILHRDVKTSNVFVTADRTLKLGDFGLARVLQAQQEAVITRVGSPFYMSPEICLNQPYAAASDIWSLGCVLYEIICLSPAFYAESIVLVLEKICNVAYEPPAEGACSEAVRELLGNMLQLKPAARLSAQDVRSPPPPRVTCAPALCAVVLCVRSCQHSLLAMCPFACCVPCGSLTLACPGAGRCPQYGLVPADGRLRWCRCSHTLRCVRFSKSSSLSRHPCLRCASTWMPSRPR